MESGIWVALKYYTIGFAPSTTRFTATMERTQVVANTLGTFTLLLVFVLGSFIIAKTLGDPKAVVVNEDENKKSKNPYLGGRRPEVGDKILEGEQWHIHNQPLIVCKGEPAMRFLDFNLETINVRVQFSNVSLVLFTQKETGYIASAVGMPLYMDKITAMRQRLAFAKVCRDIWIEIVIRSRLDKCRNGFPNKDLDKDSGSTAKQQKSVVCVDKAKETD
ncbi:hypothetical protein PTKIN_Ptkin18bG0031300 [Pterospermum kingtungense]